MEFRVGKFLKYMLDIIYPRSAVCIACGRECKTYNRYGFCFACYENLPFIRPPHCCVCGRHIEGGEICRLCVEANHVFTSALSVFEYNMPISDMVKRFKYRSFTHLAEPMAMLMVEAIELRGWSFDAVVPVPLHTKRLSLRGYNQAEYLAHSIGKMMGGKEVLGTALMRIRNTPSQIGMDRAERMWNLYNAFEVRQEDLVKDKTILLIDDVFTTGSTVDHCSSALLEAGAREVYVATFATTIYH